MVSVSGDCVQSGECVHSDGFPSQYGQGASCEITNVPRWPLVVEAFEVEYAIDCGYDYLLINSVKYCGSVSHYGSTGSPVGVVPLTGTIAWITDQRHEETGWSICFRATPPAPPA